jgi:hypothetical protein
VQSAQRRRAVDAARCFKTIGCGRRLVLCVSQQLDLTPNRLKPTNQRELPVNPADLERIVSLAELACAAAVSQPKDALVRQRLHQALAPLVSPAFPGEDPELAHLHELFAQARVWADIVRTRIAGFDSNRLSDPLGLAIQFPARDLLSILTDLLHELRRARDA